MVFRNPEKRLEEMVALLRKREYRLTPQRLALLRLIAESKGHPNAAQLFAGVQRDFPTISLASVYKTISLLKELGQIQEIDLHEESRYDGNHPEPHPHLVCLSCRSILDGEAGLDEASVRAMERDTGYQIIQQQIVFYGYCPQCRAARRKR